MCYDGRNKMRKSHICIPEKEEDGSVRRQPAFFLPLSQPTDACSSSSIRS